MEITLGVHPEFVTVKTLRETCKVHAHPELHDAYGHLSKDEFKELALQAFARDIERLETDRELKMLEMGIHAQAASLTVKHHPAQQYRVGDLVYVYGMDTEYQVKLIPGVIKAAIVETTSKQTYYRVSGASKPVHPAFIRFRTTDEIITDMIAQYSLLDGMKSYGGVLPATIKDITEKFDDPYILLKPAKQDHEGKNIQRGQLLLVTELQLAAGRNWKCTCKDFALGTELEVELFDVLIKASHIEGALQLHSLCKREDRYPPTLLNPKVNPYLLYISKYVTTPMSESDFVDMAHEAFVSRSPVEYSKDVMRKVYASMGSHPVKYAFGLVQVPNAKFRSWPFFRFDSTNRAILQRVLSESAEGVEYEFSA